MLSSPFQQPSRRQNALALQIQEARATGDEALLSRLISQWVHRYGFDAADELDLNLPEPMVLDREFSPAAVDVGNPSAVDPVLMSVAQEPSFAPEIVAEEEVLAEEEAEEEQEIVAEEVVMTEEEAEKVEEIVAEEEVLAEEEAEKVEEIVAQDEVSAEETVLKQSIAPSPVPAPPISTPRSLRRWLPRRDDDAFPKAS